MTAIRRRDVLRFRFHRHQLDRQPDATRSALDVDLLDYGVQDTGPDGSAWALVLRGAPSHTLHRDRPPPSSIVLAWTLRGAPHAYRRRDLANVATATAPWSETDAAKRIFDASTPLRRAGVDVLDALGVVAATMRRLVRRPMEKGDVSRRLSDELGEPYVRFCRVCDAVHLYEQPFRLAALQAGLVLQPGTSPPVLERVPGWRAPAYRRLADDAVPRFDVIRNHLRFFGPTEAADVATFVDTPRKEVAARWPDDVTIVRVDGAERALLDDDLDELRDPPAAADVVRLLGPFDPYLQLRDRELLATTAAQRKELWPTLGRPGAVVADGEVLGTWRPRTRGERLTVVVTPWRRPTRAVRSRIDDEAERLAGFRGTPLAAVELA